MKYKIRIILIFACIAQVVLLTQAIVKGKPWLTGDSPVYINLAHSMINGIGYGRMCQAGFVIEPTRLPGYPGFIGLLFTVFGDNNLWIILAQSALYLASVYFTYKIAVKIFGKETGLVFLLFSSVYPFMAFAAAQISPEIPSLFFITIGLYLLSNPKILNLILSAISLSVAAYIRPNLILLGFFISFFCLVFSREKRKNYLLIPVIILIAFFPWAVRNYYTFGKFTPTALVSGVGVSFYVSSWEVLISPKTMTEYNDKGNFNDEARSSGFAAQIEGITNKVRECCPDDNDIVATSVANCDSLAKVTVIENEMFRLGIENIKAHPIEYLWNSFINVFRMWFTYYGLDNYPIYIKLPLISLGVLALLLGVCGIVFTIISNRLNLRSPLLISLLVTILYFPATMSLLNTQARYTIPARLLLLLFASFAIIRLKEIVFDRSKPQFE